MTTLFFIFSAFIFQISNPILDKNVEVHENISESIRNEILETIAYVITTYDSSGCFWDSKNHQFDNQKYLEFIGLFAGQATILNDVEWTFEDMPYSEYLQMIFENFQESGVRFKISNPVINKIDIDETGFYVVDLSIEKRMYSGIDANGNPLLLKKGRKIKLDMRIDLPDYLIQDARIQYIKLKQRKGVKDLVKKTFLFMNSKSPEKH